MKTKGVVVKQDEGNPVPLEVLAESIRTIAAGVRKLREGPLNDRALFLLIQHAAPSVGGRYNSSPVTVKTIKAVFDGVNNLEAEYLKPKKTKRA